jgi:hypothetical protein
MTRTLLSTLRAALPSQLQRSFGSELLCLGRLDVGQLGMPQWQGLERAYRCEFTGAIALATESAVGQSIEKPSETSMNREMHGYLLSITNLVKLNSRDKFTQRGRYRFNLLPT